nr:hypothetical protein CFP56_79597 [Quercus suber]
MYFCSRATVRSNDPVHLLRDEIATQSKRHQSCRDAPEPGQIVLGVLARHPDVHTPHARDDVHREDNGTQHGEFAQDVGRLFGTFVHADVDLGEVITVSARQQARGKGKARFQTAVPLPNARCTAWRSL